MEFRVLGPLEVQGPDGLVALGGEKQRALLALLVLSPNRVVARDRLIDGLWGEEPPESAAKLVQLYVSHLRKLLPAGALVTRPPGYALEVAADAVDLSRFEQLVSEARGAAPGLASDLLREALGLWRGPALAEFADGPYFRVERERLEETRVAALEQRFEADLALGRAWELVPELESTVKQWPLRERFRAQLMLALYGSDRQAEALEAYRAARAALAELGLEPGTQLRELERRILTQDPMLNPAQAAAVTGRVMVPGPLIPEPAFPFAGRAVELRLLDERLARARAGEGGLVLVAGEAGGGKTRLIRELAHRAAASGVLVVYGTSDATVTTPYQPLREWLECLLKVSDPDVLRTCLGAGAEELARLVPEVGRLPGVPPVPAAPDRRDPTNDRFALQAAVIQLLGQLSQRQPLLAVADDAQWADGETVHLLLRLARSMPHSRVLLLIAFRDPSGEATGAFPERLIELTRLDGALRISLAGLSGEEVGEFIESATETPAGSELVTSISQLTDGTPLLLCELWRELLETGAIEAAPALRLARPASDIRGPENIRNVVGTRLARLDPETVALLELAAVAGPQFDLRVLAATSDDHLNALAAPLQRAIATGIIEELPAPPLAHRFNHELVRRAVYDRLSGLRRAQLHLRVGEALERVHATDLDQVVAELAHHFSRAAPIGGAERAISYQLQAADAALLSSAALREAAAHLQQALELGITDGQLRIRVQIDLGWLLAETGQVIPAATVLRDALTSATELDQPGLAAYPAVFLARWDWLGLPRRSRAEVQATAREAIETFSRIGDRRGLAVARHLLGYTYRGSGQGVAGILELERALADAEASQHPPTRSLVIAQLLQLVCLGPTPVEEAITRCEQLRESARGEAVLEATIERTLALLLAMATRFDEAREIDRRASSILDSLDEHNAVFLRILSAKTQRLLGDPAAAEQHYLAVWRRFGVAPDGFPRLQATGAALALADLYLGEGRGNDALDWLHRSVSPHDPTVTWYARPALTARLAAHHLEIDEGLARANLAALERILTLLCPDEERSDTAEFTDWRAHLRQALTAVEHSDFLNWRAYFWLALAEVERADGHEAEAGAATTAALDLYRGKGDIADLNALRAPIDAGA